MDILTLSKVNSERKTPMSHHRKNTLEGFTWVFSSPMGINVRSSNVGNAYKDVSNNSVTYTPMYAATIIYIEELTIVKRVFNTPVPRHAYYKILVEEKNG